MLNGNEDSDGYLAYKSLIKRKLRPRTNGLKMSLTIEEFFEYYLKRNKYLNKEKILEISFYKLVYFYLIQPKRLLGVDLPGIFLHCTQNHLRCNNRLYPKHEYDINSLAGRCVRLYTADSFYLVGIKGKFKSILPGIYEIICRIKLDKNESCNENHQFGETVNCYFYALADHGLDCVRVKHEMNFEWFESNYLLYGNQIWFNETMGKITVFELSDIYFGFKIQHESRHQNILFDYIQLNIIE